MKHVYTKELPSGNVYVLYDKLKDAYIECTQMQDVSVEGKSHIEVRESLDPKIIIKHLKPLEEKWLLTVSTQYGCSYKCHFCDVPNIPFKGNLPEDKIMEQINFLLEQKQNIKTSKAKIGFARMGEPVLNYKNVLNVIKNIKYLRSGVNFLPCYNSILPNIKLENVTIYDIMDKVCIIKEELYDGFLHFQISCNSTNEEQRKYLFGGANVLTLNEINNYFKDKKITNRTITLNFILGDGWELNSKKLEMFDPKKFTIKLIPLNKTRRGNSLGLKTYANYSNMDKLEEKGKELTKLGFNVVTDAVAKCEEAGLCCGQLIHIYLNEEELVNKSKIL
jgi:23S rRNA (adenine2503-C2)-methyltransferase